MSEPDAAPDLDVDLDAQAERVLDYLRPRRRRSPRLAEPLREAQDLEVETPFGPVMAWRLDPWGSPPGAPATLLVHGWEDDNALWGPMIEALNYAGRPVVAFDLPGHGFSPAQDCSIGRSAAAVRAVARALGPVDTLIAHSFGCPASVRTMADGLEIARAVLIASPMPTAKATGSHWEEAGEALGVSPAALDRAKTMAEARETIFSLFDYPALASQMTARALFIHSLDDEGCPPENSRTLADAWGGEGGGSADVVWQDGLGHRLVAQDQAVIATVAAFIG